MKKKNTNRRNVKVLVNGKFKNKIKRRTLSMARAKSQKHIFSRTDVNHTPINNDNDTLIHCVFNAKYRSRLPLRDEDEYDVDETDSDNDENEKKAKDAEGNHNNSAIKALQRRFSSVQHLPKTMIEANVTQAFLNELGYIYPNSKPKGLGRVELPPRE